MRKYKSKKEEEVTYDDNPISIRWVELKLLIETIEFDIQKNIRGYATAGIRARKGLRVLKECVTELIRETIKVDNDKLEMNKIKAKKI